MKTFTTVALVFLAALSFSQVSQSRLRAERDWEADRKVYVAGLPDIPKKDPLKWTLEFYCDAQYTSEKWSCEGEREYRCGHSKSEEICITTVGFKEFPSAESAFYFLLQNPGYGGLRLHFKGKSFGLMWQVIGERQDGHKWYEFSECYDPDGCIWIS